MKQCGLFLWLHLGRFFFLFPFSLFYFHFYFLFLVWHLEYSRSLSPSLSLWDANGGKPKSLKVGVRRRKGWRLFFHLNLSLKTPISGTSSCFKQPLTKHSLLCFKEEQTRLRQRFPSKDCTPNINNKGCTHNHLSFWSYVLVYVGRSSCQQTH